MDRFVFYDFETTGTDPAFDQPLQFAAVVTDANLNPTEEFNLRGRLAPHILPYPVALAVNGVTAEMLTDTSLPGSYDFSRMIAKFIDDHTPAIWVGYNSIDFDEEVFRQNFYQHLDPNIYRTQSNRNARMDILRVVYACWNLGRPYLTIPRDAKGRLTSKLERLAPVNGFKGHDAHDALGDVKATLFIAKLVKDKDPRLWAELLANTNKKHVLAMFESEAPLMMIDRFGAGAPKAYVGAYCGTSPSYANQVGFFDVVRDDPADYFACTDEELDTAVEKSPKLIRSVGINKFPLVFSAPEVPTEIATRAAKLAARPDFHARVGAALARRYADREPSPYVEKRIYEQFIDDANRSLLLKFHGRTGPERLAQLQGLTDGRLVELGQRLICLDPTWGAPATALHSFGAYVRDKWNASIDVPWCTFTDVEADLAKVESENLMDAKELADLRAFYRSKLTHFS